jgi:riboflavin biosynthesis pyrimidine reductase
VSSDSDEALLEHGRLGPGAASDRPRVAVNMIATVDGRTTVNGRVGDLTSPPDRLLLRHLRGQADAVLVGANTVRQEGYGTLRADAGPEASQAAAQKQPLLCIVSARLALPPELPALQNPKMRVLVITTAAGQIPDTAAAIDYLRMPNGGPVSLRMALRELHEQRGIQHVVCEGGPALNARLFSEDCVDDLFLALSPRVSGDETALTLLGGSLSAPVGLSLRSHLAVGDFVFLRYEVA